MKFMLVYRFEASAYEAGTKRFLENQGAPPPGISLLARWHSAAGHRGFALAETNEAKALYAWVVGWADLVTFEILPVVDDAELSDVLTQHFKA